MASAIMRGWEHIGYNKNTGTIIAIARKSVIFARSIDFGITWTDIKLPNGILNTLWYSGIDCNPDTGTWVVTSFTKNAGYLISTDDGLTWTIVNSGLKYLTNANGAGVDVINNRFTSITYMGNSLWMFGISFNSTSTTQPYPMFFMGREGHFATPSWAENNGYSTTYLNPQISNVVKPTAETIRCVYDSKRNRLFGIWGYISSSDSTDSHGVRRDFTKYIPIKQQPVLSSQYHLQAPTPSVRANDGPFIDVVYDADEDLIIGDRDKYIVYSEDGGDYWSKSIDPTMENFDPDPTPIDEDFDIRSMAVSNGVILVTLEGYTDKIYRSIDRGSTWTLITLSEPGLWTIKHCGNRFIMVGFNSNKSARSLTMDEV
jgi:hypothetical protein